MGNALPTTHAVRWTDERKAWFRAYCPGHTESEISAEHERVFGTPLSEGQIGNAKTKLGVRSGTHGGRFQKGCAGGFASDEHRRKFTEAGRATRFKQGEVHGYAAKMMRPVGTERVNKDGYVEVKVPEGLQERPNSNFRLKHRVVYEQAHGAIPDGCNVVFADGDKRNFDPSNLVAVPRSLWSIICRSHIDFYDAESLQVAMNVARLDRATYEARCRPRPCMLCGREFAARYPHQRTCDACLGHVEPCSLL